MASFIRIVKTLYKFPTKELLFERVSNTQAWKEYKEKVLKDYPPDYDLIWDIFSLKVLLIQKRKQQ